MNYKPGPSPQHTPQAIVEYLSRELTRVGSTLRDAADTVFYRTTPANQGSLTAGVSANYKIAAGNVIRISSSVTVTLTGLALSDANRELLLINVGTGVVVLKSEGTESSASFRFLLPASAWDLSANHSAALWYDAQSARWRGIGGTF